jgi:opacity protein-like surface antigen
VNRNFALVLMLSLATLAAAQNTSGPEPRFELFAGYQLFRASPSSRVSIAFDPINVFGTNGGSGAFQVNVNSYIGLVSEFGATRSGAIALGNSAVALNQTQLSYLFGPRMFVHASTRITPFAELLVGAVHNSRTFDVPNPGISAGAPMSPGVTADPGANSTRFHNTQNAFAAEIGAGLDVNVTPRVAVRPFQVDYVGTHLGLVTVPGVPPGIGDSHWQMNWKYSAGINFHFGGDRRL